MTELKKRRVDHGITTRELAEKTGYSKRYIALLESGKKTAPPQTMGKVNAALDEIIALKSPGRIEISIDYLRIHFKTKDVRRILGEALFCRRG